MSFFSRKAGDSTNGAAGNEPEAEYEDSVMDDPSATQADLMGRLTKAIERLASRPVASATSAPPSRSSVRVRALQSTIPSRCLRTQAGLGSNLRYLVFPQSTQFGVVN